MSYEIRQGDTLTRLREMPDASVHCVVTSPPYFGLRDYGTGTWTGGDPACAHKGRVKPRRDTTGSGVLHGRFADARGGQPAKDYAEPVRAACACGAVREDAQIGLEETPAAYVARLVSVFEEVRRVLRPDGTLWLNLGDCYANDGKWGGSSGGKHVSELHGSESGVGRGRRSTGLKPKDLVGAPWRVAFALQDAGWYLRSDIVWHKRAPMPESVRDRPTRAHEYVFLLAKSERYHYDAEAIREPLAGNFPPNHPRTVLDNTAPPPPGAPPHRGLRRYGNGNSSRKTADGVGNGRPNDHLGYSFPWQDDGNGRNARSVWTLGPKPFPEAHFATFPPELPRRCILAGCPEGGTVLDPFSGAGTVGVVALRLGRSFLGIELNPTYVEMASRRIERDAPLFNRVEATA